MREVLITVSPEYRVLIGGGLIDKVDEYLSGIGRYERIAIVTDSNVEGLYLDRVRKSAERLTDNVYSYVFKAGELSKNISVLSDIYDFLAEVEMTRTDLVIALGGGVVGDMVGFASSTYLRGIDFINIPTTLLSMVDSSVGGKTAVNIKAGKNQVGAFYQPRIVLCDTDCLSSLPHKLIQDGVGEIAKYAVLEDRGIFDDLLADNFDDRLVDIVEKCVQIKNEYVSADVYDKGRRQLLNLGHTLGHVIEKETGYIISHGEAVMLGMYKLTEQFCGTFEIDLILDKLRQVADRFDMPYTFDMTADSLWRRAVNDKKRHGDYITLARPYAIGDCRLERVKVTNPVNYTEAVKASRYDVTVYPHRLCGEMTAPPSKSDLHRLIICAAFYGGKVEISNVVYSDDILATLDGVCALGAKVERLSDRLIIERGELPAKATIDCRECGSTLRFFLPLCAMLGVETTFVGADRLGERGYKDIICAMESEVQFSRESGFPLTVTGQYTATDIAISGSLSSQFVSGIIMAAFACKKNMHIKVTGGLQSVGYVDMTAQTVRKFGSDIDVSGDIVFTHRAETQELHLTAESDYSNGAFYSVAGVDVRYNNPHSAQGDRVILDILDKVREDRHAIDLSVANIPDLAPILAVLASTLDGETVIRDCSRLRAKECDRLSATEQLLTACGVKCHVVGDELHIIGGRVSGGVTVDGYGDHRMVMAASVLATFAEREITITGAQAINKSYPGYFEQFRRLGGEIAIVNIR